MNPKFIISTNNLRDKVIEFHTKRGYELKPAVSMTNPAFPHTFNASAGEIYMKDVIESKIHNPNIKFVVIQPCFRRVDIENVNLNGYCSFFEMVGKMHFTSDFEREKENQLKEMLDFLVKEIGLDRNKIWITVFGGGKIAKIGNTEQPEDKATQQLWVELGIPRQRIVSIMNSHQEIDNYLVRFERPWELYSGYGTDIFYDLGHDFARSTLDTKPGAVKGGRFIELATIWMLNKWRVSKSGQKVDLADSVFKNFAVGFSLERIAYCLQKPKRILEIDTSKSLLTLLRSFDKKNYYQLCDILRSIFYIASEGNKPGNKGREYDLRLLFRNLFVLFEDSVIENSGKVFSKISTVQAIYQRKITFATITAGEAKLLKDAYQLFFKSYQKPYNNLKYSLDKIQSYYTHEKMLFYERQYKSATQ